MCDKILNMKYDLQNVFNKDTIQLSDLNDYYKKYNMILDNNFNCNTIVVAAAGSNLIDTSTCSNVIKNMCNKNFNNKIEIDKCMQDNAPSISNIQMNNNNIIKNIITTIFQIFFNICYYFIIYICIEHKI